MSVVFLYVENNIQKIISNEFSKRSNYQMKLDDVDFNLSGNVSFDNIIIFNSNNDTLFYAPNLTINPKSVQNAIVDNNYDFENIAVKNGIFFIQNFETIDFLKSSNSVSTRLLIKNLNLNNLKIIFDNKSSVFDLELNNLSQFEDFLNFSINSSKIDLLENQEYRNISGDFKMLNKSLQLDNLRFLVDNSSFFTNVNIENIDNLDSLVFYGNIYNSKLVSSDFISGSKPTEFDFNSNFNGNIKKISFTNLKLDSRNTQLDASVDFNLKSEGKFPNFRLNFKNLNSSSFELENIYPEIFGSILPSSLKSFGNFFFTGELSYNEDRIKSKFTLKNVNGEVYTDLDIFDFEDIDNASYVGIFRGVDVDLSNFITLPFLGKSTFRFTIDGKGFVPELLNTKLKGKIDDLKIKD